VLVFSSDAIVIQGQQPSIQSAKALTHILC
jgi:hypothetical protein